MKPRHPNSMASRGDLEPLDPGGSCCSLYPNGTLAAEPIMPGCSIVMRVDESLSSQRDLGEEEN